MLSKELGKIEASAILTPLMPLRTRDVDTTQIDLAFDSEYQNDIDTLISYQFSGRVLNDSFDGKRRRSNIYTQIYVFKKKGGISAEEFFEMVIDFLHQLGYEEVPGQVYLISYAAAAELRYIQDYQKKFRLRETNKGLGWEGDFNDEMGLKEGVTGMYRSGKTTLTVIDLAGFYPGMGLAKVGDAVKYPKVELSKIAPNHEEQYWKEHMCELFEQHREAFDKYSRVDAEIALLGWEDLLRQWVPKGLDPHRYRTIPSLAMADFRTNWLVEPPVPIRYEAEARTRKTAWQGYSRTGSNIPVFDGDIDARYMSLSAYWGGYNVAFVRGHKTFAPGEAFFYDFISLYVASGILQPLPNAQTTWIHGKNAAAHWQELEGFIRAYFEFPVGTNYPNMPVMHDRFPKLTFPLRGTSTCTIAEAKVALRLGAKITPEKVCGFYATASERDHTFARFLKGYLDGKNKSEKGSLFYYSFKLTMVAAIGKLAERDPAYDTKMVQQLLSEGVSLDFIHKLWRSPTGRKIFQSQGRGVGGAWMPEWASLILGRARSYAALVVANGCYHISTDGGVFPVASISLSKQLPEVKQMEAIGSGFRAEGSDTNPAGEVSEIMVVRTRMYGSWYNGEVVHNANHSVHLRGDDWNEMLRHGIIDRKIPATTYETMRLAKTKDIYFMGKAKRHFDEMHQTLTLNWHWDNKRFCEVSIADPFTGFSETHPWSDLKDAIAAEYPVKKRGRRRLYETDADRQRAHRQKQKTIT